MPDLIVCCNECSLFIPDEAAAHAQKAWQPDIPPEIDDIAVLVCGYFGHNPINSQRGTVAFCDYCCAPIVVSETSRWLYVMASRDFGQRVERERIDGRAD